MTDYNEEQIRKLEAQLPQVIKKEKKDVMVPELNLPKSDSGAPGFSHIFPGKSSAISPDPEFAFSSGQVHDQPTSLVKQNYKPLPVENGTIEQKVAHAKKQIESDPVLSASVSVVSKVERRIMFSVFILIILLSAGFFGWLGYTDHFKTSFTDNSTINVAPAQVTVPVTNNNYNNITVPQPVANINNTIIVKMCQINGTITNCP